MEELISLMTIPMLGDQSSHNKADDVGKPWSVAWDDKEMLVEEWVTNVSCTWNVETW